METLSSNLDKQLWSTLFAYVSQFDKVTQAKYGLAIRHWMAHLGSNPSNEGSAMAYINATPQQAISYVKRLRESGQADRTIKSILDKVKRSYKVLIDSGICKKTPFAIVRSICVQDSPNQKQIIDFELVMDLILLPDKNTQIGLRDRAILAVMFGGALRPGEVCKLKTNDFSSINDCYYLYLERTKNGKSYNQVIPIWVADFIKKYLESIKDLGEFKQLFISFPNRQKAHDGITTKSIRLMFKKYAKELGYLKECSAYSARATAISKLIWDRFDLREIQLFARHSSLELLAVYDRRIRNYSESVAHKLNYES